MSLRNLKAVVYWTIEKKVGIEPVKSVPENARFKGAVTSVQYSGNGRWYPARILCVSDDQDILESKLREAEIKIVEELKKKSALQSEGTTGRSRRSRKRLDMAGIASEREVAHSLGMRRPVPSQLLSVKSATSKGKKENVKSHAAGQQKLDEDVSRLLGETHSRGSANLSGSLFDSDDGDFNLSLTENGKLNCSNQVSNSDDEVETPNGTGCSCPMDLFVKKHSNSTSLGLLRELTFLFENNGDTKTKYISLLPISDKLKKVELVRGKGIMIAQSDKDSLIVDFKNKPSSLIRETLYCLYGKKVFSSFHVTARGRAAGSYGIEEEVLKVLNVFINNNVDLDKRIKFSDMVASINRRTPDWRLKGTPSSEKKRKSNKKKEQVHDSASDEEMEDPRSERKKKKIGDNKNDKVQDLEASDGDTGVDSESAFPKPFTSTPEKTAVQLPPGPTAPAAHQSNHWEYSSHSSHTWQQDPNAWQPTWSWGHQQHQQGCPPYQYQPEYQQIS